MTHDYLIRTALIGGALIGVGSSILLLFSGRIAGISGVLGGLLQKWNADAYWRLAFVVGIPVGVMLVSVVHNREPVVQLEASPLLLIIGGLLVGFGARLGSGCTSGHGVCGLARLSPRSIVATATFMLTGALTVFVLRHLWGAA
jgi:uncharacterized membrane protein YedE/YeeE